MFFFSFGHAFLFFFSFPKKKRKVWKNYKTKIEFYDILPKQILNFI